MQKVAIFGGGGQLGVELTALFRQSGYEVSSFERSRLDITDTAAVEQALAEYDPAVVLNAAAYNQVDLAESANQPWPSRPTLWPSGIWPWRAARLTRNWCIFRPITSSMARRDGRIAKKIRSASA